MRIACRDGLLWDLKQEKTDDTDVKDVRSLCCGDVLVRFVDDRAAGASRRLLHTNGAQAAHGCGYPTMEACRSAAAGIGGSCSQAGGAKTTNDAMAYQPKKKAQTKLRPGGQTNSN